MADRDEDKEGKVSGHFKANGLEHFAFSSKTVISWGVLSGLAGLIFASISVYQSFGSNVDERISNHRELNKKLDNYEFRINFLEKQTEVHTRNIQNIENEVNARKAKK